MGQYYIFVNIDKREYLHPHKFDDSLKLSELTTEPSSLTMKALVLLCADGNGPGSGDFPPHPLIGRWSGDRIVVAGDYAEDLKFVSQDLLESYLAKNPSAIEHFRLWNRKGPNLHEVALALFADISEQVLALMLSIDCFRQEIIERLKSFRGWKWDDFPFPRAVRSALRMLGQERVFEEVLSDGR